MTQAQEESAKVAAEVVAPRLKCISTRLFQFYVNIGITIHFSRSKLSKEEEDSLKDEEGFEDESYQSYFSHEPLLADFLLCTQFKIHRVWFCFSTSSLT